jgi:DNA-3-methyladenine glycosylase II
MFVASNDTVRDAAEHLSSHDPVLAAVIKTAGLCTITPHTNYYWELIDSIISQQLSVKAAASIERRFQALFDEPYPAPERILNMPDEKLHSVGLSRPKVRYIKDVAEHIVVGSLRFDHFDSLSNEDIIHELVAVKGIGEWTAHMFLIFCIGRLDILAHGDLGIRNGIKKLYRLPDLPTSQEVIAVAEKNKWHPYESVACWYVWQSLKNLPG